MMRHYWFTVSLLLFSFRVDAVLTLPYPLEPLEQLPSEELQELEALDEEALQSVISGEPVDSYLDLTKQQALGYVPGETFKSPPGLEERVEFWKKIYSEYTSAQVLMLDAEHMKVIYEILDFSKERQRMSYRRFRQYRAAKVREVKRKYMRILAELHEKRKTPEKLQGEALRVYKLFEGIDDPYKFLKARRSKRIRAQLGQRDQFLIGLRNSGLYLAHMEKVFAEQGMPIELTRLPFVESYFNLGARSHVGATGVWQFMRSTGRKFLTVNMDIDERRDPFTATLAAAQLLRSNYDSLKSWPLAVTAYNHGRLGIVRAVEQLGTSDLSEIIKKYRSNTFGFASQNFYAEFLATLYVEQNYRQHFGEVERLKPVAFDEVKINSYVSLKTLAEYCKVDPKIISRLNPALSRDVLRSRKYIPKGYTLRIPKGHKAQFLARYHAIPPIGVKNYQLRAFKHRIRPGENLALLARRYGISTRNLIEANDLRNPNLVRIGQVISIPSGSDKTAERYHRVRRGENLQLLARRYRTTIEAIRRANRLASAHHIQENQLLLIP